MKKTILSALAILALTAPLAWSCSTPGCEGSHSQDNHVVEPVPAVPDQSGQPKYKATPRGASISDFVTPGRSTEKGSSTPSCEGARTPVKPLEQPREPEKKCGENCN